MCRLRQNLSLCQWWRTIWRTDWFQNSVRQCKYHGGCDRDGDGSINGPSTSNENETCFIRSLFLTVTMCNGHLWLVTNYFGTYWEKTASDTAPVSNNQSQCAVIWGSLESPWWLFLAFCPKNLGDSGDLWIVLCHSLNAGSALGIPWGGGNTQTLPYAKECLKFLHSQGPYEAGTKKLRVQDLGPKSHHCRTFTTFNLDWP